MRFITILLLILFSSNFSQAQIKNRVYGEVHLSRIGQDIKGGAGVYNDEFSLDFLQGFEIGYAISDKWLTNFKCRRNPLGKISGNDFSRFENQRIEFSVGIEYIRRYHERHHWSYGVSYFFESIKSTIGNCRHETNPLGFKHLRNVKGFSFELGFNYRIKSDFWLIIGTRYRVGNTWIPNHTDYSPFAYFCYDRNSDIDVLDFVSKVGVRFFL